MNASSESGEWARTIVSIVDSFRFAIVESSGEKNFARQAKNSCFAIESLYNLLRVKKNGEVIAIHFTALRKPGSFKATE